jgi:hypothetical protein
VRSIAIALAMRFSPQLGVLLSRQTEPDGPSAHGDPLFDRLMSGKVELSSSAPGQVQNFDVVLERESSGEGSLEIRFQERDRPATLRQDELHVDPMAWGALRAVAFTRSLVGFGW